LVVEQPKPLRRSVTPRACEPRPEAAVWELPHPHADLVFGAIVAEPDKRNRILLFAAASALAPAASSESPRSLLHFYDSQAKASDPGFSAFSAERGEHLFRTKFSSGKPDTPSCTACHTTDPKKTGQTRAGKDIEPMAASANPKRYTDQAKAEMVRTKLQQRPGARMHCDGKGRFHRFHAYSMKMLSNE
jgi:hypothetical protein